MGLMSAVILSSETPIDIRKDWLAIEIYCPEDTADYVWFPLNFGDLDTC